jgi:hypothetical protein
MHVIQYLKQSSPPLLSHPGKGKGHSLLILQPWAVSVPRVNPVPGEGETVLKKAHLLVSICLQCNRGKTSREHQCFEHRIGKQVNIDDWHKIGWFRKGFLASVVSIWR